MMQEMMEVDGLLQNRITPSSTDPLLLLEKRHSENPQSASQPPACFAPRIASLAALATRNFTTRLAGI
jgi:hypothetical protein